MSEVQKAMMAILFAVGEPVAPERIALAVGHDAETVRRLLDHLRDLLEKEESPFQLLRLDGKYQLSTRPCHAAVIRTALNERRNVPLSQAALEVLAVVAYNQPVTRAYIEQVRGVDSSSIVAALTEKGLLEEAGRLELPGRPICYQTTEHFLRTFGLSTLDELPPALMPAAAQGLEEDGDVLEDQIGFDSALS